MSKGRYKINHELDWLEIAEAVVKAASEAEDRGDDIDEVVAGIVFNENLDVIARTVKAHFTCFYEQFGKWPDDAEEFQTWRRDTPEGQWAIALGQCNDPPRRQ
jgi:hypothetical protein